MGVFGPGFKSVEHERNFIEGRARRRRGGPDAPMCAAAARTGKPCGQPPLAGDTRCAFHGGQHRGGLVLPDQQARQARNRLGVIWRREPWTNGRTIDLAGFEWRFRQDVLAAGIEPTSLAPGVADKARWKWRRFALDRPDPLGWHQFAHVDLPAMIAVAGAAPPGWSAGLPCPVEGLRPIIAEAPAPGSKRRLPGRPASSVKTTKPAPKRTKPSADRYAVEQLENMSAVRPAVLSADIGPDELDLDELVRDEDPDAGELAVLLQPNSDIWPLLVKVPSEHGRRRLAELYMNRVQFPGDGRLLDEWMAAIQAIEHGEYL